MSGFSTNGNSHTYFFNKKHLDRVALNPNAVAFFGHNYRGLIAAREISEVINLNHNRIIFVFSSIFAASVHVSKNKCLLNN